MTSDHIVVFAIDDEPMRAMRLVVALSRRGFTVIANETAGGVTEVYDFMYDAAAVVAISGCGSTAGWPWIGAEIGRIVPVVFTSAARMPNQLAQLEPIDLTDWGEGGSGFEELVRRLAALVEDARKRPSLFNPLLPGPVGVSPEASDVSSPLYSIGELRRLTSGVRDIAELLADDAYHTRQVRATLDEIGASYRVVLDTIDEFYASGSDPDHFDVAALARIRGGRLAERIHNGRGHCKRIGARYFAYGGLRDAIRTRAHAGTLEKADATFGQLTNADMDLFDA